MEVDLYSSYFAQDENNMSFYEEVSIDNFEFKEGIFTYPCPCGDLFTITYKEILDGEIIARCQSCSLIILCKYEGVDINKYK